MNSTFRHSIRGPKTSIPLLWDLNQIPFFCYDTRERLCTTRTSSRLKIERGKSFLLCSQRTLHKKHKSVVVQQCTTSTSRSSREKQLMVNSVFQRGQNVTRLQTAICRRCCWRVQKVEYLFGEKKTFLGPVLLVFFITLKLLTTTYNLNLSQSSKSALVDSFKALLFLSHQF